jgi:outer membrane lipoprotein
MMRRLVSLAAALWLTACAALFDIGSADRSVTPRAAAENVDIVRERTVAWGGTIVAAKNLKDSTQFEVVGYPLDRDNRPNRDAAPIGRFLAVHPGYLETADYAPGRLVTFVGVVKETRAGTVGEAPYTYPLMAASRLHLWPHPQPKSAEPSVHFGIGIGIIR